MRLFPDPLESLGVLIDPSRNRGRGPTSKMKGEKGREKRGGGGEKEGRERGASSLFNFWLPA